MSTEENQISVIDVVTSTDEEFAGIMATLDAMTEDQAAKLLKAIIDEIAEMQRDNNVE